MEAAEFARRHNPSPRLEAILKSPAYAGAVESGSWGAELAPFRQASAAFIETLARFSAFDRILSDGGFIRMPLRTRIAVGSTAATASVVNELATKPLTQMEFGNQELPQWKASGALVITDELARSTSASATRLFESELRKAVAVATDNRFLRLLTEASDITSNESTGTDAASFVSDLQTALQAVEVGVGSMLYLILPMDVWKTVSLLRDSSGMLVQNGSIGIIRVVPSASATAGVLLDATAIGADAGDAIFGTAREAVLKLDDEVTDGSSAYISLWQHNLVGLRVERYFGAAILRPSGIALINNIGVTA
jgi:HK97 family phage major capsid protein